MGNIDDLATRIIEDDNPTKSLLEEFDRQYARHAPGRDGPMLWARFKAILNWSIHGPFRRSDTTYTVGDGLIFWVGAIVSIALLIVGCVLIRLKNVDPFYAIPPFFGALEGSVLTSLHAAKALNNKRKYGPHFNPERGRRMVIRFPRITKAIEIRKSLQGGDPDAT